MFRMTAAQDCAAEGCDTVLFVEGRTILAADPKNIRQFSASKNARVDNATNPRNDNRFTFTGRT